MIRIECDVKVKKVVGYDSRVKYVVYKDKRTPEELCWSYSRTRAYEIAKLYNSYRPPVLLKD